MAADSFNRENLTFEQAEGAEPLPRQLQLGEITNEARAVLFNCFYKQLKGDYNNHLQDPWRNILYDNHVYRDHLMADEFDIRLHSVTRYLKGIFESQNYIGIFGFSQFVLRHPAVPDDFYKAIDRALEHTRCAYRVIGRRTIAPVASPEEKDTLERALVDLAATEFRGAREHLRKAAEMATAGKWADCVRESIHAVEATARSLAPSANTLEPALQRLGEVAYIHQALKRGFASIYGYTSDEKGVRHSFLENDSAKVDETDALFMLGACAAFVSYLINKGRAAGIIKA